MIRLAPSLWHAAFWAGLISLDITGCGPWMVSQPMVAGSLFGWWMGQVSVGVFIGGVVQLLWMDQSPVGVGLPFDATAMTLLAVYWATLQPAATYSHMLLALILAAPFGFLCRAMDHYARRLNTLLAQRLESISDRHLSQMLTLSVGIGLAWIWLRYAVFYAVSMALGQWVWSKMLLYPVPAWLNQGFTLAAYLCPVAGLGVCLELFLSEAPEQRFRPLRFFKPKG